MTTSAFRSVCLLMLALLASSCSTPPAAPPRAAVLATMERVADWQLAHPAKWKLTEWHNAAGYAGMMALAQLSPSPRFHAAMMAMGESNAWKLGRRPYDADDHAVGQTYVELFLQHHDPRMIAPMRAQFDAILAAPRDDNLEFEKAKNPTARDRWSWCDALFMGPPAWVRLAAATGDARYREFASAKWRVTSDFLYDKDEHLFYRDSTYFAKREANGKKVFWGRGNGWVMAGLARPLDFVPPGDPGRAFLEAQFREMAEKVLSCQQSDGLWRASLLDPASYPMRETSGSGFYCFALCWGVNHGLLPREKYLPAVLRAWAALTTCVAPDGKLTHVQPVGADPKKFDPEATEVYGVGAFLLAGSEVCRLGKN